MEHRPVNLMDFAGGDVEELFKAGLRKITEDLDDASKKPGARRSFALKFSFEPDEQGYSARMTAELVAITLAPSKPAVTAAFISHENGQLELLEVQQTTVEMPENVVRMEEHNGD